MMIKILTTAIDDIERVVLSKLKPYFSSVSVLIKTLLHVKQTGVRIPNSTGTQVGRTSPSFRILGASEGSWASVTCVIPSGSGGAVMINDYRLKSIVHATIKIVPTK